MNFSNYNQIFTTLLEQANRQKSGILVDGEIFKTFNDKIDFIKSWHESNPNQFFIEPGFKFSFVHPLTKQKHSYTFNLLYGNKNLGICHILHQRDLDKLKPTQDYVPMSEQDVWDSLYNLDKFIINCQDIFIDFDSVDQPYTDRVLMYNSRINILYCIVLQNSPNSLTYLHTLYKPTKKYLKRIQKLNEKWANKS